MRVPDDQEMQVRAFVEQHCIETEYHNDCRTTHPPDHLFMIFFDFDRTGLVVDPTSELPLLIIERECDELSSIEMVSPLVGRCI